MLWAEHSGFKVYKYNKKGLAIVDDLSNETPSGMENDPKS